MAGKITYRARTTQPGHQVQVGVKVITPIGGAGKKLYQFTAIDDGTRLRALEAYPRCNQCKRRDELA